MEAAIPPVNQEVLAEEARSSQGDTVTILENEVQQQELIDQIVRAKAASHSREDEQRYTQPVHERFQHELLQATE